MTDEEADDWLPMDLTEDLPQFGTARRGYDRGQVEDFVRRLQDSLSDAEARAERAEQAGAEASRLVEELRTELLEARRGPTVANHYEGLGERIDSILRLAAEEAGAMLVRARAEADAMIAAAEQRREEELATARQELDQVGERRDSVVGELRRVQDVLAGLSLHAPAPADGAVADPAQDDEHASGGGGAFLSGPQVPGA
jgi:cell division septum initiation protein DivIVA